MYPYALTLCLDSFHLTVPVGFSKGQNLVSPECPRVGAMSLNCAHGQWKSITSEHNHSTEWVTLEPT